MSRGRSGRPSANPNSGVVEVRLSCCLQPTHPLTHPPSIHPSPPSMPSGREKKKKKATDSMNNDPALFTAVREKLVFANSPRVAAVAKSHRGDGEKDRNLAGSDSLKKKKKYNLPGEVLSLVSCCKASFFLTTELPGAASPPAPAHGGSRLLCRQPMGGQVSGRAAVAASYPTFCGWCLFPSCLLDCERQFLSRSTCGGWLAGLQDAGF